jgi:AraC family transcriptional regulator, transcriptional activator of pobA
MPFSLRPFHLAGCADRRFCWDNTTMRTVRLPDRAGAPPTFSVVPAAGEPPVSVQHLAPDGPRVPEVEHTHDFPVLAYFESAAGTVLLGGRQQPIRGGDLYVVAPGDVIGMHDAPDLVTARGWAVMFTPDALGPDTPGASLAWRTHPMLFPFVRGQASGALRLAVPEADRPAWSARLRTMHHELTARPDGYHEAVRAHLVLLLVEVSRLAADVVGDLRVNQEPLLAEVFSVIEDRYTGELSLREVARAVGLSPGHLTSTVRRRTGRTVQEWITQRRMTEARRLLARTALPVADVGRRVGYPDPGYFARAFGRAHGTSPARWRQAGR